MQKQRWVCRQCGYWFIRPVVRFPVACKCGYVDNHGETVEWIEVTEEVSKAAQAIKYLSAVERWIAAGRPVRTDEEVDAIFSDICQACPKLVNGSCQVCGCRVRSTGEEAKSIASQLVSPALTNKLRMGTEHCPIGKW